MSTGDSTLMMLLSLNLLLLVFFVMLNSMATEGAKRVKTTMAQVSQGYNQPTGEDTAGDSMNAGTLSPAWRSSMLNRLQGVVMNRIDLRVLPQVANADKVEIEIPLAVVFDPAGRMIKPEVIRNLAAAAGTESGLKWQVRGKDMDQARRARILAVVAGETGHAEAVAAGDEALRMVVTPGVTTKPDSGLQVQQIGEGAGGSVRGVQGSGHE